MFGLTRPDSAAYLREGPLQARRPHFQGWENGRAACHHGSRRGETETGASARPGGRFLRGGDGTPVEVARSLEIASSHGFEVRSEGGSERRLEGVGVVRVAGAA